MKRFGKWLFATAVAGAALGVGTVHTVTLCVVTAGLAVATALVWWNADRTSVRRPATLLLLAASVLTAFTVLQCVPIPSSWLALIAPRNADVWGRALMPLHEVGPSWAPLTVDPIASHVEVLKGIAYLLAFITALRIAHRREGVTFLGAVIVLTGAVLALAALLHPAFGTRKLFGVYEPPSGIVGRHIAPLMNANNLAGYLNLAFCMALASTLAPRPRVPRPIAGALALFLAATQLWVASRGGVITLILGAIAVVAILRLGGERRKSAVGATPVVLGAAMAIGATLLVLGASREASDELLVSDVTKLSQLAHFARMLPAYGWLGCGRGAFESAFPAFRTDIGYMTWSHPENVVAQWTLEWGVPIGLGGLAVVAFALRPSVVLARSSVAAGAWGGLAALAVQNLADLGTEIPGLMLTAVVAAAIVVGGSPGHERRVVLERWSESPRAVCVAAVSAGALAVAWVVPAIPLELHAQERLLHGAVVGREVSVAEIHELARVAMSRHPAEPYLPFIVALRAARERDDNPMPWLGATLERANVYGPAHLVLARVLARKSPAQARMEYRFASSQAPEVAFFATREAEPLVSSYQDALELVPSGNMGVSVIKMLIEDLSLRLPATSTQLDGDLSARAPGDHVPLTRAARAAVADVEAGSAAPWCDRSARDGCIRDALDKSERVERAEPDRCEGFSLHARARMASGDVGGALGELQIASDQVSDRIACLQELSILSRAAKDWGRAEQALGRIAASGCATDAECAQNLGWVASFEEESGNDRRALAIYKRAYEHVPADDNFLQKMAELAARAALHVEAAEDYDRLVRRHPDDPRWHAALDVEREAAAREASRL
jgi:tetratricopeptide (TPR) repeat protein